MVLIGIGGNLPSRFGLPQSGLSHAVSLLPQYDMRLIACSPWYGARAVPPSDQPDFVNGVVQVETDLAPAELLDSLHRLERLFGRERGIINAARTLDLDILAYNDYCSDYSNSKATELEIPHPRMHQRAFVLVPLCDLVPDWRHPRLHRTASELLAALPGPYDIWRN